MEHLFKIERIFQRVHILGIEDRPVPEFIDPVYAKTSPKRSFCMTENGRFGLVFAKTGSINSGTVDGTA